MNYKEQLAVIATECSNCRLCPHGSLLGAESLFDKGPLDSPLVIVGEAPGERDDQEGYLYAGDSGQLLNKMIARMQKEYGQSFPEPYICNVVKHWPSGSKLLKFGEDVKACSQYLFRQLNTLPNAKVVIAIGRVAAQTLLGTNTPIGKLRGRSYHNTRTGFNLVWTDNSGWDLQESSSEWRDPNKPLIIVPTWHPAYLLHLPNNMQPRHQCWADLQIALRALNQTEG